MSSTPITSTSLPDIRQSSVPHWGDYAHLDGLVVPAELEHLASAIEYSRRMLYWEDDWDGEGSPAYTEATWSRAIKLILDSATRLYSSQRIQVAAPDILPGPDGSIDIQWRHGKRDLLINIATKSDEPATYHGDGDDANVVKGTLETTAHNDWLLLWLMQ